MQKYVIDTNVAIVANGRDDEIAIDCRLESVKLLQKAINNGKILLDGAGEIQEEYRRHLNPNGQPGVGDRFYEEVLKSHPEKIERVPVDKQADGEFVDVPRAIVDAGFDPSDRKFVAVALKGGGTIYNAVDSDWVDHLATLEAAGVSIFFVCGCDQNQWRGNG